MCSSNTTRPEECPAIAPPESQRCFSNSNAAGVRCTQGMGQHSDSSPIRCNIIKIYSVDRMLMCMMQ